MKRWIKSACFYTIVIVCIVVVFTSIWNFPNACKSYFPDKNTVIYPDKTIVPEPINAELNENGEYRPTDIDPGLVFTLNQPNNIKSIQLTFDAPTETDIDLELYYAPEDKDLSNNRVKKTTIPQNTSEFYCNLNANKCHILKVGIHGTVDIQSISFSPKRIIYIIDNTSWFVVPLIALIILVVAVVLRVIGHMGRSKAAAVSAAEGPVSNRLYIIGFLAYSIILFLILYSLGYNGCLHRIDEMMTRSKFLQKTVSEWYQSANNHP